MRLIGTRNQVRDALQSLESALSLPRDARSVDGGAPPFEGARSTRYAYPERLSDGQWLTRVKAAHVALLSPALAALVVAELPDGVTVVSSTQWMRPLVLRATIETLPQDLGPEHLWDTSTVESVGVRYERTDGLRSFVTQYLGALPDDEHAWVLWFGGDRDDPGETEYALGLVYGATLAGLIVEALECTYEDGAWLCPGVAASGLAGVWPSTWRVLLPGDSDASPSGATCVREVVL